MIYSTKKYHQLRQFIGNNIRIFRENENMTQSDLAKKAKVDVKLIDSLEKGKGSPHLNTLFRITCALDIQIQTFFDDIYNISENGKNNCLSHFSAADDLLTDQEAKKIFDNIY